MFATASSCGMRRGAIWLTSATTAGTSRQPFDTLLGSGPDHIAPIDISARKGCSHGHSDGGLALAVGCVPSAVAPGVSVLCANDAVAAIDAATMAAGKRSDRVNVGMLILSQAGAPARTRVMMPLDGS